MSDISDWTPTMLSAKIREIENALRMAEIDYKNKVGHLLIDLERVQNELSKRSCIKPE